ncbi:MAG: hypothetical protein B7X00_01280, partial [Legionella sp. 21-45-4]
VVRVFKSPFFHEVLLQLPRDVNLVLAQLREQGIAGGVALDIFYPELGNTLLVCATEMRTGEDIQKFATALASCLATKEPASC